MNLITLKHFINKTIVFINPGKATYWHTITKCNISQKPATLDKYYLDFSSKANYPGEIDEDGIPLYSYFDEPPIKHPIVIAQYAFGLFEVLQSSGFKDESRKKVFRKQVEWFLRNKEEYLGGYVWRVNYLIPEYNLNEPWISALAQGEAISVLTRAAKLFDDIDCLETAEKALIPFEYDVKNGGLVAYFKNVPLYEEYPSPSKTVAVLNGFMFSLFGLYDLYLLNKNEKAKKLFDDGINSLLKLVDFYDFKYWVRYYLFDYPKKYAASLTYLLLMIEQLKVMYLLTGEKKFNDTSKKWESYAASKTHRTRALLRKILYARKLSK